MCDLFFPWIYSSPRQMCSNGLKKQDQRPLDMQLNCLWWLRVCILYLCVHLIVNMCVLPLALVLTHVNKWEMACSRNAINLVPFHTPYRMPHGKKASWQCAFLASTTYAVLGGATFSGLARPQNLICRRRRYAILGGCRPRRLVLHGG